MIPATQALVERHGEYLYSSYGFLDSFNPSFEYDIPLKTGRIVPGKGWVASDYIGIDQGPILVGIANHRNEFVWNVMKRNPHIRRGLERAGFSGGWLAELQAEEDAAARAAGSDAAAPDANAGEGETGGSGGAPVAPARDRDAPATSPADADTPRGGN